MIKTTYDWPLRFDFKVISQISWESTINPFVLRNCCRVFASCTMHCNIATVGLLSYQFSLKKLVLPANPWLAAMKAALNMRSPAQRWRASARALSQTRRHQRWRYFEKAASVVAGFRVVQNKRVKFTYYGKIGRPSCNCCNSNMYTAR